MGSERHPRPGRRRQSIGPLQKPKRKDSVGKLRVKSSKTKTAVTRSLSQPPTRRRHSIFGGTSLVNANDSEVKKGKKKKMDKEKKKSKKKKKPKSSGALNSGTASKKRKDKRSSTKMIRRRSLQ